jgi:hypothetical protein
MIPQRNTTNKELENYWWHFIDYWMQTDEQLEQFKASVAATEPRVWRALEYANNY